MKGTIKFQYRSEFDVVIATVAWHLETEEDIAAWFETYQSYFRSSFSRKVDVIFNLSAFDVSPRVAALFGQTRARILNEFVLHSYRVKPTRAASIAIHTSRALHGADATECRSVEAALERLRQDRLAEQATSPSSGRNQSH